MPERPANDDRPVPCGRDWRRLDADKRLALVERRLVAAG
jgi:hypothetical protein